MNYRQFGKLDWQVSALGFGAMRLPTLDNDSGKIDETLAIHMIRTAIDAGVNYVDTAYGYHRGTSEVLVGKALKDGYREKVCLATKMPSWLVKTPEDLDRLLDEQLTRLDTNKIDFYLLHALNAEYWKNYQSMNVFDWAERKMAEGKFDHLGFSFHDEFSVFVDILNGYEQWDFCQIQYNYMDTDYQAGIKGLELAAEKGLGVIVMEPLRGGNLAKSPAPALVQEAFARSAHDWQPAEWALQWVWDQPQVSLALSGMSTLEQVQQNLVSASRSGVGTFSTQDHALLDNVRQAYHALVPIPCTACEYCLPCPSDVAIPSVFTIYNEAIMYDAPGHGRWAYADNIKAENRADNCVECGLCEEACPQQIEIINWLKIADTYLTAKE